MGTIEKIKRLNRLQYMNGTLERNIGTGCFMHLLGVIAISILLFALFGCKTIKQSTDEKVSTADSVKTVYVEKIVKVPVKVIVEVPVESKEKFSPDSVSHLETSFAVSDAKMVWIDGVAFLRHSLENKPQKIEKSDSVPVVYKYRNIWNTRRVTYTKTVIREKQLAWWQKALFWLGISFIIILIVRVTIFCIIRLRR